MVRAGRGRRPIFFAANHLGPDARLTSVAVEGKKPRWQGMAWSISLVDTWHNVQSQRQKLRPRSNPRAIPGALIAFEAHFSAQCPFFRAIFGTMSFSGAIPGTMSVARYYKSNNFIFETRFQRTLVSKTEKPVQARAAIMPAIVGRNARLRAYSPDTRLGPARSLGSRQRGIEGPARNDLRDC
jgi:hypothetical protein